MTDRAPTLAGVIERGARGVRDRISVCRAGYVVAYDIERNRADVQLVHDSARTRPDGVIEVIAAPILRDRPVAMLAAGHLSLTAGLREGDRVWVIVSDVSLDEYVSGRRDETYRPQDPRRFDLSDGIVWPMSDPPVEMDGQPVMGLRAGEALHIGDATTSPAAWLLLARADLVRSQLAAIQTTLDSVAGATFLTEYQAPGDAADIASSRVKVDD